MKNIWFLMAIMCFSAGQAQAEKLVLRSGDHPTFSRLTIPISSSQKWEGRQTEQGIDLRLPGFSDGFELEGVFLRMRRDRISEVHSSNNTLTLKLACDCKATVFRSGTLLVIDVADSGTKLSGPPLESGPDSSSSPLDLPAVQIKTAQRTLPWIGGNSPFGGLPTPNESLRQPISKNENKSASAAKAMLLERTQQDLIKEVASAASAGLLQSRYQIPAPHPQQEHPVAPEIEPQALPEAITAPARNMRITSSMDHPFTNSNTKFKELNPEYECPDPNFLSVETWGDDQGFSAQVGPARTALMNARDQLDHDATKHLAQLYLFFGFGAEALDVLSLSDPEKRNYSELTAIAEFFEYGAAISPNSLGRFLECPSDVALWASLSFHEIPPDFPVDTNAALRALNKLPKHLRQIVAPALSERFLKYGDVPSASAAMRSVERLVEPLQSDAKMAQIKLAEEAGDSADALLEEVLVANTTNSPEALVKIVEGKLANDEPLSYETATLVEAYVQELRGTPMGSKLQQTQIIALSQTQRFKDALIALDHLSPSLSPDTATELRGTILAQLSKRADDLVFSELVFTQNEHELDSLGIPTKLLIASRLLDLGFAAKVQQLLASLPDTPRIEERQLLTARAALALNQPFQAQAELIGMETSTASLLLAQAKEMTGAYGEASEIFSSNSAPEQAAQAAWLSEDWQSSALNETSAFEAISTLARDETLVDDLDLGPLGSASRALDESREARDTLQKLLSEPIVQVTPNS